MAWREGDAWTRRAFLGRGLTLASAAATAPYFLKKSAVCLAQPIGAGTSLAGVEQDRVLVVVQLAGGNDGLNTVAPVTADEYYRARPAIAVRRAEALRLGTAGDAAEIGLHPALDDLKSLYDDGLVSLVQGVGYPNPNRSHFASMDIWQTADESGRGPGWLGRFFDNQCAGSPAADAGRGAAARAVEGCPGELGLAIGDEAPRAMLGDAYRAVSFESARLFRWTGHDVDDRLSGPYDEIMTAEVDAGLEASNPNAAFLTRTAMDAKVSSETIRRAVGGARGDRYPRSGLARQLAMVAAMIRSGLPTRVYYVSLGGFDTHAGQGGAQGRHANLLREFGGAVRAFYADLGESGDDERTLTMSFSEFGRRVAQNASNGTDHGAAAPMFLVGPMVRPGVLNPHPSLTDLDDGDVKHSVDFRSVYAGVLEDWMGADAHAVLGSRVRKARLIERG